MVRISIKKMREEGKLSFKCDFVIKENGERINEQPA